MIYLSDEFEDIRLSQLVKIFVYYATQQSNKKKKKLYSTYRVQYFNINYYNFFSII